MMMIEKTKKPQSKKFSVNKARSRLLPVSEIHVDLFYFRAPQRRRGKYPGILDLMIFYIREDKIFLITSE